MHIDTIRFPGSVIDRLEELGSFFSRTVFIVSHKSESLETLLGVLWYLPAASPTIVVTNCPAEDLSPLADGLRLANRDNLFLVHQKDERIASYFRERVSATCSVPTAWSSTARARGCTPARYALQGACDAITAQTD